MSIRDLAGAARRLLSTGAAVVLLAGCADQRATVVSATLCLSPPDAARDVEFEVARRIQNLTYGNVAAQAYGAKYIDLRDPALRANVKCCGNGPSFKDCPAGTAPVDLFIDTSRTLTPDEEAQLQKQLQAELEAANDARTTGRP
jgi:hypothetical protein